MLNRQIKTAFFVAVAAFSTNQAKLTLAMDERRTEELAPAPNEPVRDEKQVLYYLEGQKEPMVIVNFGQRDGLIEGAILKSQRPSEAADAPRVLVETGLLKVQKVGEDTALAQVIENGSELSRAVFPEYPGVMAGDSVERPRYLVSRRLEAVPETILFYQDIFRDPKSDPTTLELTDHGKHKIAKMSAEYKDKRFSLLVVKGFTDQHGTAQANQVESYQRALTVRQYLIEALGFDENRVVAIGLGELAPLDPSHVVGADEKNRRITLEVVPNL